MKNQFVNSIKAGNQVKDIFMLTDKRLLLKKDGEKFLTATFTDKTGKIKGVAWDDVDRLSTSVSSGDFVEVTAKSSEYRGASQLVVADMRPCPPDSVDPSDFIRASQRSVDVMFDRLLNIVEGIETPCLKNLLQSFFDDEEFASGFKTAPAAKMMHHNYLGGLLEHTLSMTILAEKVGTHYGGIDKDLLLAGAILHDIGKIKELEYKYRIEYSDEGKLLTHIVIGIGMLNEKIAAIQDFPEEKAVLLKLLIVSHYGVREFGSPEPPMTIEAVILNYIDEIDAKVNGIREFMAAEDPNEPWTSYHRLLGRSFFRGRSE